MMSIVQQATQTIKGPTFDTAALRFHVHSPSPFGLLSAPHAPRRSVRLDQCHDGRQCEPGSAPTDRCLDPTTHAFVLQDMGTHAQLMQSSEVYRNLVKRQIVGAVPGGEDERGAGAGAS